MDNSALLNLPPSQPHPRCAAHSDPVYQVNFHAAVHGRRFSISKRRIRWTFGFGTSPAVHGGPTTKESSFRGEEHDVVLVWSIVSSKRLILLDGEVAHFSVASKPQSKFEFSWTMRGNNVIRVTAHASPPMIGRRPNVRQFDLTLDGQSFFDMPHIFDLVATADGDGFGPVLQLQPAGPSTGKVETGLKGTSTTPREATHDVDLDSSTREMIVDPEIFSFPVPFRTPLCDFSPGRSSIRSWGTNTTTTSDGTDSTDLGPFATSPSWESIMIT